MTTCTIALNCDTQDLALGTGGVDWVEMSLGNDSLIITNGSDVIADGEPIPSQTDLNQAGLILTGVEQIVSKYLLADISENELKAVHNMGNQNKRYVMAFDFDGATTSEPILEAWDDVSMQTYDNLCLGAGTATNSWLRGITTTSALPGTNWIGSRLAGSADGHFLWLNNQAGALSVAKTLYCNLKMVIPATATESGAETPILVVKYTTN